MLALRCSSPAANLPKLPTPNQAVAPDRAGRDSGGTRGRRACGGSHDPRPAGGCVRASHASFVSRRATSRAYQGRSFHFSN